MTETSSAGSRPDQKGMSPRESSDSSRTPDTFSDTSSATPKDIESMDTESVPPANSESALAIAASISLTDEPLSAPGGVKVVGMAVIGITSSQMYALFQRLFSIFPLNVEWTSSEEVDLAAEVYANLLSDIPADECKAAVAICAKTLTRFPFPADIRAACGKQ